MRERRLVRARDVARVLDVSEREVYRMGERGWVPFYRVGARGIRFDLDEVLGSLRREGERS